MAKTIKINYNSKIASCMHRPVTGGAEKYVIYPKNKDYTGDIEGNTKAEQDPEYIKLSAVFANSPTNIRQVFITGKRVYTYLYAGIQVPQNKKSETVFMKEYQDEDLFSLAQKKLEYEMSNNKESLDNYKIEGNILGAITHPYTCNNIEEIYLDWTVFLSDDTMLKKYFHQYITPEAIYTWLTGSYGHKEIAAQNDIIGWFKEICMGNAKDIRKRFPRLRMIAIVSKLDELITTAGNIPMVHILDSELLESNKEKAGKTWYDLNKARIVASGSQCFVCRIPGAQRDVFEIKDQQYRFDREHLKAKVNSFLTKLKDAERKARYGDKEAEAAKEAAREATIVAGDAETYLVELEAKYGIELVQRVLSIVASDGATKTELTNFFSEFTKPNRQKYAPLAGIKL